jgi:hypothetical protein
MFRKLAQNYFNIFDESKTLHIITISDFIRLSD